VVRSTVPLPRYPWINSAITYVLLIRRTPSTNRSLPRTPAFNTTKVVPQTASSVKTPILTIASLKTHTAPPLWEAHIWAKRPDHPLYMDILCWTLYNTSHECEQASCSYTHSHDSAFWKYWQANCWHENIRVEPVVALTSLSSYSWSAASICAVVSRYGFVCAVDWSESVDCTSILWNETVPDYNMYFKLFL